MLVMLVKSWDLYRGSDLGWVQFSVLTGACLKGRNADEAVPQRNISSYEAERNAAGVTTIPPLSLPLLIGLNTRQC